VIDLALIERHRRFEDPAAGIAEEFVTPVIGGAETIGVLTRPTGPSRDVGWVICHSFGEEQSHLYRLDVMAARGLAAVGFPVLRFHGQGYGDSAGSVEDVDVASHLADAADAVDALRERTDVRSIGVAGARFGGTVAALTADRLDLPMMALWQPVSDGAAYVRAILRGRALSRLAREGHAEPVAEDELRLRLSRQGFLDVNGLFLSARASEQLDAVDLVRDLRRFQGRCLLVSVTRSGRSDPTDEVLAARLEGLGATCDRSRVVHPQAPRFGRSRANRGVDPVHELDERIVERTVAWSRDAGRER
jgi:pimeloyl-ACP methyl ester carboxylesterase